MRQPVTSTYEGDIYIGTVVPSVMESLCKCYSAFEGSDSDCLSCAGPKPLLGGGVHVPGLAARIIRVVRIVVQG